MKERNYRSQRWVVGKNFKRYFEGITGPSDSTDEKLRFKASDSLFQAIFESSFDLIIVAKLSGEIIAINRAVTESTGWTQDELLTTSLDRLIYISSEEEDELINLTTSFNCHSLLFSGLMRNSLQKIRTKNRGLVPIEVSAPILTGDQGESLGLVCFCRNLKDLVDGERTLVEAMDELHEAKVEKMAALGLMAGGVAHEINNPLTIIIFAALQLRRMLQETKSHLALFLPIIDKIESSAKRISQIVGDLKAFYKSSGETPPRFESLGALVQSAAKMVRGLELFQDVEVRIDIPIGLEIECQAVNMLQGLLPLLKNAFEAAVKFHDKWIEIAVKQDENSLLLLVTDSGLGIPKEIASKMMLPFFTTKDVGQGTGLGLCVAKGMFESQKAGLAYDPASPHTRFIVDLAKVPTKVKGS
jgi:PAS domain S-box-containing protein